jgi:cysteine desulfurase
MAHCAAEAFANPSSQHRFGRKARQWLEDAREGMARILGAELATSPPDQLIFTSGGTEANNLALLGLAEDRPGQVVVSKIEHPSVLGAAQHLRSRGIQVAKLGCTPQGVVDLQQLAELLRRPTRLVSVMLANNETGVLQPLEQVASLCRHHGALVHTDAVQAVGKIPVSFRALGVDALTVAAHKFHGPRGSGALLLKAGVRLAPLLHGGFQQSGLRPGTECVTLAVGMWKALELWQREAAERSARWTALRDRLEAALLSGWPSAAIHGKGAPRLPQTTCISLTGLNRQAVVMALDLAGLACSTGSACASGSSDPSPALVAMGCPQEQLASAVRFSLGATSRADEVEGAVERILLVCNQLGAANSGRNSPAHPRGSTANLVNYEAVSEPS